MCDVSSEDQSQKKSGRKLEENLKNVILYIYSNISGRLYLLGTEEVIKSYEVMNAIQTSNSE
jgi:hypothetical protein